MFHLQLTANDQIFFYFRKLSWYPKIIRFLGGFSTHSAAFASQNRRFVLILYNSLIRFFFTVSCHGAIYSFQMHSDRLREKKKENGRPKEKQGQKVLLYFKYASKCCMESGHSVCSGTHGNNWVIGSGIKELICYLFSCGHLRKVFQLCVRARVFWGAPSGRIISNSTCYVAKNTRGCDRLFSLKGSVSHAGAVLSVFSKRFAVNHINWNVR